MHLYTPCTVRTVETVRLSLQILYFNAVRDVLVLTSVHGKASAANL